jgi:hypothetical protein
LPGSLGLVGWSMAVLPLLFGFACSAYFVAARPGGFTQFIVLSVLAVLTVVVAVSLFIKQSHEHLHKGEA